MEASEGFKELIAWTKEHGAFIGPVKIGSGSRGRGLFATRTIPPGETVLVIPETMIITPRNCALKTALPDGLTGYGLVMAFLLEQKYNPSSVWKPYIDALPARIESSVFLTTNASTKIKSVRHRGWIEKQQRKISSLMDPIREIVDIPENVKMSVEFENDCKWAYSALMSRTMYMKIGKEPDDNFGLVPFADMLNHDDCAQLRADFNYQKKCYEFTATHECYEGSEILVSYGMHSNKKLFKNYGFILENNPHNQIRVEWNFPAQYLRAQNIFHENGFGNGKFYLSQTDVSFNFLVALRLVVLEQSNMLQKKFIAKVINDQDLPKAIEEGVRKNIYQLLTRLKDDIKERETGDSESIDILANLIALQNSEIAILISLLDEYK